jgi:hypothetical protein
MIEAVLALLMKTWTKKAIAIWAIPQPRKRRKKRRGEV